MLSLSWMGVTEGLTSIKFHLHWQFCLAFLTTGHRAVHFQKQGMCLSSGQYYKALYDRNI